MLMNQKTLITTYTDICVFCRYQLGPCFLYFRHTDPEIYKHLTKFTSWFQHMARCEGVRGKGEERTIRQEPQPNQQQRGHLPLYC